MGQLGSLDGNTPQVHPEAWIAPGAILVGRVTLGPGASVWYGSVLRADDDEIIVGADCNIQDQCCLHVDRGEPAILGERVSLGHRATVHGALVGDGALVGIGAIVLGRAWIGAGSLVAAGTVDPAGPEGPGRGAGGGSPRPGRPRADRRRPGHVRGYRRELPGPRRRAPRRGSWRDFPANPG